MKRLISIILVLVMSSACFTGCMTDEEAAEVYAEVVQNILQDIIGGGYDPSEGEEAPSDLFDCTYTEEDYKVLCDAISEFEIAALEGKSLVDVTNKAERMEYLTNKLTDLAGVANIVYFASMKDEDKAAYEKLNAYVADASAKVTEAYKAVYLSDSPVKSMIFAEYTESELAALVNADGSSIKTYTDAVNNIQEEFYALDNTSSDYYENVTKMYVSFVENGNLLANEYGYDNYYDYASAEGYMRDYEFDKEAYRNCVIDYIVPILSERYEEFLLLASSINPFLAMAYTRLAMDSDYAMESEYINGLIETFDGDIKDTANLMFDGKHIIRGDEGSYEAACTLPLSCYGEAVCYFATGYYGSLSTVAHEMGHFISMYHYGAEGGSYDFLETHSQSTEVMLLGYLENVLDSNIYSIYESEKIITLLSSVLIGTIVDEFEDRVYHSETPVTEEEIDRIIDELCEKYGEDICELLMIRENIKMVIIQSPAYYISYSTSGLSAIGLYCKLRNEGYGAAYDSYEKLQRGPLGVTFIESLEYAGFPNPFEKSTFELIEKTLAADGSEEAAA